MENILKHGIAVTQAEFAAELKSLEWDLKYHSKKFRIASLQKEVLLRYMAGE